MSTRLPGRAPLRPFTRQPRRWLILILLLLCGSAFAEGTRTLHPNGATGERGVMDAGNSNSVFANVARARQFLYVYAQKDEIILLGSRNRSNGGDIYVYAPQSFGNKGDETIPGTRSFSCSSQAGRGTIASRAQELAGPNSADGTATVPNGYAPCWYKAPSTGIYGVLFTGATSGGQNNSASIATPPVLTSSLVSAWDVTVRSNESSLADLNGRLFTYAWTVYLNANSRHLYNDLFYVSTDGYRYRQTFRGLDPNRAAFYANSKGFIDNGAPLYRDIRGSDQSATGGPSGTAGITAQRPEYPIFFSDVSPTGPNAAEVNRVLTALAIPLVPAQPQLTSPAFVGNVGGNTSTVSAGGVFTFTTLNTLTYEIVISRDGVNFDPANVLNRVLTGSALSGNHTVLWDGKDNNGNPFPVGNYKFRIAGRNGEIHFPMIDVEANLKGGPTLTKLNGSQDTTVYYDDRGYRAANGNLIGALNGHLCGAGSPITQPVPNYSLLGVNSNDANLAGSGNYYRAWNGSNDSNTDCSNNANEYFGTAKGLDLWALEKSPVFEDPVVIVEPTNGVDVGTMVSVTPTVLAGDTAYGSFAFSNAGDVTATGVTYSVTLGNPAQPGTCPASVAFPLRPAGVTATYNPAPACTITFTGMPTSLAPGQSLNFNFNYVVAPTNPGPIPVRTQIAASNENNDVAPNTATAQTVVAKPVIAVAKSASPAANTQVDIGDTITYTLSVNISNAPLTSPLVLADTLGTGLTFGSVTSSHASFACSGSLTCTLPTGTGIGAYTVTYTATVDSAASVSVHNGVVPSGGGGENPPACNPCSVEHPVPTPAVSVVKTSNPASGTNVVAGQTITYTLTATITDAALTQPLVLTDTLSANQTFGSLTSLGAYTCTGTVQCTLPAGTAPGTYAVSYTATVNDTATGQVGNSVVATGGGPTPPACTTCSTEHPLKDPAVSVAKTSNPASGTNVVAGQTITYTLTATITDAALTQPLVLTDTLSANQTFGSVTSLGAYTCTGTVQCTLPAGTAPGTYAVSYTATVNNTATGQVGNSVVATGGGPTPPACTTCSTEHPLKDPAIAVVKTSNPASGTNVVAGQTITYTLTATVTDAALTQPLVLTDTLSANQTFGSVTSLGAYTCTGSVQCTLPAGTAPGTYAVSYTATVNDTATGQVGNSVVATGGGPTPPACTTCSTEHSLKDPAIAVVKTSNPASGTNVVAGQTITYTLTATITDAALTQPLVLTDTLSANQTFGSVTSLGAYTCTGTVQCTLPAGTAPGTYAVSYTATVNNTATGQVGNSVVATGGGPTPPACTTCSTEHPLKDPAIAVVKTSNPASGTNVVAGQTITYTLTATVTDAALTQPLVLTDTLSANQTFGSVTSLGAYTCTGSVQCTLPAGTAPGTYSVSYTATVNNTATGQVGNSVVATGGGPTPPACTTCSTEHPLKDPAIAVVKTSNPASGTNVVAGQTITYTLTATVTDAALTQPLVLTDTLSANQTFGSVTSLGAYTCTGTVQCTLPAGSVPGTYSVSYTATVNNTATGQVGNSVVATGGGPTPPACTTCSTEHPLKDPAVSVAKTSNPASGTNVVAGQTITYTLTATVTDAALTQPLVLTDTLSANQTFGSVTSLGAYTCTGSVQCTLPAGTAPGTYAVSYTATVNDTATGQVGNSVVATGGGPTPPSCTTCSTEHPLKDPAIAVVKTSNPASGTNVIAGETITYTLTATVSDAALTSALVLTDTLGAGLTFDAVTSAGSYTADTSAAPVLKFTLASGTVPGTYAVSYAVKVKPDAAGTVKNAVFATGGSSTPPTCTTCSTEHPLKDPAIAVVKTSNPASGTNVMAGETITYTLTATVSDAALTSALVLTDTLGAGLTFDAVTSAGSYTADTSAAPVLKFTLASGTVPGTYAVSYAVKVKPDAAGTVKNAVVATGGSSTPPACTTCSTEHPLKDPAIHVVKSSNPADGATVAPGETLTFTLTATIADAALTSDLELTDTLGAGLTFGAVVPGSDYASDTSAAPVLKFTLPSGTVPGTYAVSYTAVVDADAVGNVVNAVVADGGSPTDPVCNPCSTTHPLEANVSVTKALTGEDGTRAGIAEAGETLTYAITLRNSGGVAATGVAITDRLDPNTTFVGADNGGSHAAGLVNWSGLTVPAGGSLVLTVQARVADPIPQGVTHVANLAYLTGSTPPACPPGGPQCVVTPTAPSVSVTKALSGESIAADGLAEPGEELTYTITVRNEGGTPTVGTIVNETVPQHTSFVSGTPAWTCAAGSPAGTACEAMVDVPAHDGTQPGLVTLTYTVRVDDPLPSGITSIANAVALDDGTPPDCVALPTSPACVVVPTVNVRMTKTVASVVTTGPSTYRVGYRIEIVNLGGSAATYTLTDTLGFAPGVVFTGNAQVATTGGTLNPALAGGQFAPVNGTVVQISASNVSVAAGATHEYAVSVPIGVQPGSLQDGACDGTPGHGLYNAAALGGTFALDSAACAPIDGDVALIHLVKTVTLAQDVNGNRYGDVGDVLGYEFTISNPGTLPLTTVQLFDPRVQNLHCAAVTASGRPFRVLFGDELFDSGFEGRAGGGDLPPGDSVTCTASYVLTADDVARRRVVNSATATGSGPAGQTVSSVATAIFTSFR